MKWLKSIIRKKNNQQLPSFLRPFLWSYDFNKIDKQKDKNIIIKNILDYGTEEATNWLRDNYTNKETQDVIRRSVRSAWSKKSINFWELIYKVSPKESRF